MHVQRLEEYLSAGGALLRVGYTTGTCAVAATHAACELLLAGEVPSIVAVHTPAGIEVLLDVEEATSGDGWARCAVRKDAGDDPDVTDGVLVHAEVRTSSAGVVVEGGVGVGRVTRPGLDQPVGAAAINSVPRAMIAEQAREAARRHGYVGGLLVTISIPDGVRLAKRTFNPRLGIEGGISVLGTTGIVRPMSEDALVSSLQLELRVLYEEGVSNVLVVPGNYGRAFAAQTLGITDERAVTCSNYVGAVLDEAARLRFASVLLVGHLGKLVKVAGGIMNTHSQVADCRMEILAAHAACMGAPGTMVAAVMDAVTTDAALGILAQEGLLVPTMESLMQRMARHLAHRAGPDLRVEAIVFSNVFGVLGSTRGAYELVALHAAGADEHEPRALGESHARAKEEGDGV